jgi:hypothetical protein
MPAAEWTAQYNGNPGLLRKSGRMSPGCKSSSCLNATQGVQYTQDPDDCGPENRFYAIHVEKHQISPTLKIQFIE